MMMDLQYIIGIMFGVVCLLIVGTFVGLYFTQRKQVRRQKILRIVTKGRKATMTDHALVDKIMEQ